MNGGVILLNEKSETRSPTLPPQPKTTTTITTTTTKQVHHKNKFCQNNFTKFQAKNQNNSHVDFHFS